MHLWFVGYKTRYCTNWNNSDCPCNLNCLNGCTGCPNPICVCGDNSTPQNQENLDICIKKNSIELGQCILDCNGNLACEQSCVDSFKSQHEECPCQVTDFFLFQTLNFRGSTVKSTGVKTDNQFRMTVLMVAHVMDSTVNQTKNRFWY